MKPVFCKKFIEPFSELLQHVQVDQISDNRYCRNYLQHILDHKLYYLHIYAMVLDLMNNHLKKETSQQCIIDFGTGNGLLGIFAKFCGFGRLYCMDTDQQFLWAAEKLANQLNVVPDGFILGDIHALKSNFENDTIDAVIGTDVIEHIYDLQLFFSTLKQVNPQMTTIFTTASNPHNFIKTKSLQKLQQRDELLGYQGDAMDDGFHPAYLTIRKNIITHAFPQLSALQIEQLSASTRGLIQQDILDAVNRYIAEKILPQPADTYNTCNPYNGSWTERLLPIEKYKSIYNFNHFQMEVHNGFYDRFSSGAKKVVNAILNMLIKAVGGKVSPFIVLVGYKK